MGNIPFEPVATDLPALFTNERLPLLRMATLIVGSAAIAEEIVADAFVVVAERWDGLDRPGGYLRTTVVNGCAQVLRRRATEDRVLRMHTVDAVCDLPVRLLEVRDALDRLSDRQRIVVVLRYFVDITDEEIAEVLGARPSTVRSLARRAFAVLRKELA